MEVRIYDAEMNLQGLIENQTSVLWNRSYFEAGSFELYCPVTPNNRRLLHRGNLIWMKGAAEAGVIEWIRIEQSDFKNEITCKGRFLESYMSRRLIRPTYNAQNKLVEVAMREILSNAAPIPLVQLGTLNGFTERVSFQATYKNLLDYETKLGKYANIGFRFRPNFSDKTLTFELYKGLDHSVEQSERTRVIFSESFNNLSKAVFDESDQRLKTVCYIGGEGEGSARKYAIAGDDTLTGLERREMFVSAADLRSDDLTDAEYTNALIQRGQDKLESNSLVKTFECETEAYGNFVYKRDYDLGDVVTVRKENWGIQAHMRMTGVTEIYENGAMKVSPILGNPLPETIDWSDING